MASVRERGRVRGIERERGGDGEREGETERGRRREGEKERGREGEREGVVAVTPVH